MSDIPQNQIGDWLKKLERESWQLELLVSAFTIFLLIQAIGAFDEFLTEIRYQYNASSGVFVFVYIFLVLLKESVQALAICLIAHLTLRGFWIGTIGLRSVQENINFERLNYNDFFTERLKKKVISLDQLVIKLDEICSVIFAFAFLVISMLLAFGLYLLLLGVLGIFFNTIADLTPDSFDTVIGIIALVVISTALITGLLYMIDYFTLGFFKKVKWLRKIYYPFYRVYNVVTLAALSRSIYYYMISKFTKRKIRGLYGFIAIFIFTSIMIEFDQHQYFPEEENDFQVTTNYYDDMRQEGEYIESVSISSSYVDKPHLQLFLRYNPKDNDRIKDHCPDFVPLKDEGLNWRLTFRATEQGLNINSKDYSEEDFEQLLTCLSSLYQISVNDSVYQDVSSYFYIHPAKNQRGLLATIPTDGLSVGENVLKVKLVIKDSTEVSFRNHATIPFWYQSK